MGHQSEQFENGQPYDDGNGHDPNFLAVRKSEDLDKVHLFVGTRHYNYIHANKKDKKGQPLIGLMLTEPGQRGDKRGLIVCRTESLHAQALEIVQQYMIQAVKNV